MHAEGRNILFLHKINCLCELAVIAERAIVGSWIILIIRSEQDSQNWLSVDCLPPWLRELKCIELCFWFDIVWYYLCSTWIKQTIDAYFSPIDLTLNRLHVTGFLRVIYAILNASVILKRNETRGGNLLLSGTVRKKNYLVWNKTKVYMTSTSKRILPIHSFAYSSTSYSWYYDLAYTKTGDSIEGALWLASQTPNILCYLPPRNSGKNCPSWHPWQAKKSSKFIFCGIYYLTVLVHSTTTIHLSVGG